MSAHEPAEVAVPSEADRQLVRASSSRARRRQKGRAMSDTPRTNASRLPINSHTLPGDVVYADFARELERELTKEKAAREDEVTWWNRERDQLATIASLRAENTELRYKCAKLDFACNTLRLDLKVDPAISNTDTPKIVAALQDALASVRAENERLKAEVTNWISHCACDNPCNDPEPWTTAGRAISALQKENAELARKALTPSTSPATPASAVHPCSKSHPPLTGEP